MSSSDLPRLDRRAAIKWMMAATATAALAERQMFGAPSAATPATKGYGVDPLLNHDYKPGDFWPLTMTEHQRKTSAALCGLIIPAEGKVPSAADLKVHDFIDEWISSPYPDQQGDRATVLKGLEWIDLEAGKRFGKNFAELDAKQMGVIADDICHAPDAKPELAEGARFFAKFRDLTTSGFFTTPEGMTDLGYIGNVPLAEYPATPRAVLEKLGLV